MKFVTATVGKDIVRWLQDANAILIWLAIPLMIGGLMIAMSSGSGSSGPSGKLLINDQDNTLISGFVVSAYTQEQMAELLAVTKVSQEEGDALMADGEASGFLTIPAGFQDAFLKNTPLTLTLRTNPSQTILPGIIQDVTEILLDAGFYAQAMFGDEISTITAVDGDSAPTDIFVSDMAVRINEKMTALGPLLSTPPLRLEIVEPPPEEPRPDLGILFLPGIVLMSLLFTAQGLSADYWAERETGTLRRLVSTPGRLTQFVYGKTAAASLLIGAICSITLTLGFWYLDIGWSKFFPALIWILVAGSGFFAWFAALQMFFPTRKAANLLTTIILFPLLMIGGSFFPLDALPDWLAAIGRVSPNGFVVDRLTNELVAATAWSFDLLSWLIVLGMTISGLLLCVWRLQTGFASRA